jgi:transposase IS66 family protein
MSSPPDIDELSAAELRALVVAQWGQIAELQRMVVALRDEVARLKGRPPRPNIKPSGMDRGTEPKPPGGADKQKRRRGDARSKITIDEERVVAVAAPPPGAEFKGYADFVVQDLVIKAHVVKFRRERWLTPDGKVITAALPVGSRGHFGPQLRRFVLTLYHQGQTTVARLTKLLCGFGIVVSKRAVLRLLNEKQDDFVGEAHATLRAALSNAAWITVDDTGARHKAKNGYCTQIGNADFAWFGTTGSKSRLNFLELLRAGHKDYVVNAQALDYMRQRSLSGAVIAQLAGHPVSTFANRAEWMTHLDELCITALKVSPDPVTVATEGALWGSIKAHGLLPNTVIVSDDAGQFNIGLHGLCWVHAERLIHKLDAFTDHDRAAQTAVRGQIWELYADLKTYRRHPGEKLKEELLAKFDGIFSTATDFVTLDRLLGRLQANKAELLMVLDRPEIPLHTNGSENDIRCQVTRRRISGGTRSDIGQTCRDAFLGLMKTCAKLNIEFWDYLGDRLAIPQSKLIPQLPQIVRAAARPP